MANPQKAKGTRWERDVVEFLKGAGLKVYKPRQEGFRDVGDIHAPPFALQAKDWKDVVSALREGLSGAVVQASHAELSFGAAVVKRARKPVGEAYFLMRLEDGARLMKRLREAEDEVEAFRRVLGREQTEDAGRTSPV